VNDLEALHELLRNRSVRQGDFVLASGRKSSYYIDARLTTMSAEGQGLIGTAGLAAIRAKGWKPAAIGGLTMGADPVAYAVAHASLASGNVIDAFSVRKEAKKHGTGKKIEGNFSPGASVVVVEDVITSGGSALQAIEAIQAEGGIVLGVLAVVDREEGGLGRIEALGISVVSLTTTTSLGLRKTAS
jgi:orotate phosphoribosyltransferase